MKNLVILLVAGGLLGKTVYASAAEPDSASDSGSDASEPVSYGAEVDVVSRYLARGLAWSEHSVLQPTAHATERGVTLSVAGNVNLTDETLSASRFNELDVLGRYDLVFGNATLSPSLNAYIYPDSPDTAELGATLSYNLDILTVQTHQFVDILDNAGGWYADFGAFRSQPLGSRWSLETTASVALCSGAFSRYYIGESLGAFHVGAAALDSSLIAFVTDAAYFRLHGAVSRLLEKRMRDLAGDEYLLAGGLAFGIAR